MSSTSLGKRTWFLRDEPLSDLQQQDRFSHNAYVGLLTTVVAELDPPFTLGVFGSWGVGKSSIVNELSNRINRDCPGTTAVTIDIWKYSDDSLRRQFLYDLQQGLREKRALSKDKDYVREIYEELTEERTTPQRFSLRRLWMLGIPLLLTFGIAFILIVLLQIIKASNPVQAILAAFVAPAALYLVAEATRVVIVVSKDAITRPVYFSEDQFERKFQQIVHDSSCNKLVIVADNLDRCSHELVVDTLSTIKTFLEPQGNKCIFIIPCDDNAIRQHVKAAYRVIEGNDHTGNKTDSDQYASEYLRKFFSGSVRIDPFLPEELELYIEHLLTQMKLTETMPDHDVRELIQMLGFLYYGNPRQLKQLLNNITSKYLAAKERELEPFPQIKPPITDNILFLAKVVAIEMRFPDLYDKFMKDNSLFGEVSKAAVQTQSSSKVKGLLEGADNWELLTSFLRTTAHISADNPKAFFHLKQSTHEAQIPNYSDFEAALRRGDAEHVFTVYSTGTSQANAARSDVIIRSISDWSKQGYNSYAWNAVRIAAYLHSRAETYSERFAGEVTRIVATNGSFLNSLNQFQDHTNLFLMLEHALPAHQTLIQDAYVQLFTNGDGGDDQGSELQYLLATIFVARLHSLGEDQKDRLRAAMSEWGYAYPVLLETFSSTPEARTALLETDALIQAVDRITVDDLTAVSSPHSDDWQCHPTFLAIIRCQQADDQRFADEIGKKIANLAENAVEQNNDGAWRSILDVGLQLRFVFYQTDLGYLMRFVVALRAKYSSAEFDQRKMVMVFVYRHFGQITDDDGDEIVSLTVNDFIPSVSVEVICELIALHKDPAFDCAPWTDFRNSLSQRLVLETDSDEADRQLDIIASELVPEDYEFLVDIAVSILKTGEFRHAITLSQNVVSRLPINNRGRVLAARIFSEMLNLSVNNSQPSEKRFALESILKCRNLHTKALRAKLDEQLIYLIENGGSMQQQALQILELVYERDNDLKERYVNILRRFVVWLLQLPSDVPLDETMLGWLDKVIELKDRLLDTVSRRDAMIRWLLDRQRETLPIEERVRTVRLLVSLGQLPDGVLYELVPVMVHQAQSAPDDFTRDAICSALVDAYRENDRRNGDVWRDLEQYRRGLLTGSDAQRKLGRRIGDQMREIRRAAGET